jgi:hypothetical protein
MHKHNERYNSTHKIVYYAPRAYLMSSETLFRETLDLDVEGRPADFG